MRPYRRIYFIKTWCFVDVTHGDGRTEKVKAIKFHEVVKTNVQDAIRFARNKMSVRFGIRISKVNSLRYYPYQLLDDKGLKELLEI